MTFTCINKSRKEGGGFACNNTWSDMHLTTMFGSSNKSIEKIRSDIEYDSEKARMASTMPLIERIRTYAEYKAELTELLKKKKVMWDSINSLTSRLVHTSDTFGRALLKKSIKIERMRWKDLKQRIENKKEEINNHTNKDVKTKSKAGVYNISCADTKCNGFVSNVGKCAVCDKITCRECGELKKKKTPSPIEDVEPDEYDHICDPNILASIKLVKQDSKKCPNPKCTMSISRIDGCMQMWCTNCKTAFHYKTGKIETDESKVHNPHYFRDRFNDQPVETINRRDENGMLSCFNVDINIIHQTFYNPLSNINDDFHNHFCIQTERLFRFMLHLRDASVQRLCKGEMAGNETDNEFNRIRFLMGNIDESKFKQLTTRAYRAGRKAKHYHFVLTSLANVCEDIVRNSITIYDYGKQTGYYDKSAMKDAKKQIDSLFIDANKNLKKISDTYKSVQYSIGYINNLANIDIRNVKNNTGYKPTMT